MKSSANLIVTHLARSHLLLCWRLVHLVHRAEERNPCIGCINWQQYGILQEFKQLLASARWTPEVQSPIFVWCLFFHDFDDASWDVLGHCFGTILKFWRFQKLSMPWFEPQKWDLQSRNGPGAARAQNIMKNRQYFLGHFGTLFWHYFENLEVSGGLNGTNRKLSARSTIWEGCWSFRSSATHKKKKYL